MILLWMGLKRDRCDEMDRLNKRRDRRRVYYVLQEYSMDLPRTNLPNVPKAQRQGHTEAEEDGNGVRRT
jgi:hypothetical protein